MTARLCDASLIEDDNVIHVLKAEQPMRHKDGRRLLSARAEVADDTPRGRLAKKFLEKGQYVPDYLVVELINEWIGQVDRGWVLDGFPRTLPQAEELDRILAPEESSLRSVLLHVDFSELEIRVDR